MGLSDHKILNEVGRMKIFSPKAPWRIQDKVNSTRLPRAALPDGVRGIQSRQPPPE